MPATKTKGGVTTPRQFRFTEAELARIDELGRTMSPEIMPTRIAVLRVLILEGEIRRGLYPKSTLAK